MHLPVPEDSIAEFIEATNAWWRGRQRSRPDVVYHYTSARAFKLIVESDRLWATLTSELNDITELTYAEGAFKKVLAAHARRATLPEVAVLYPRQVLEIDYLRPDAARSFVSSLSGAEDDLLQWCMYGDGSRGVAIGFDTETLVNLDAADLPQNVGFFDVSYDATEQSQVFEWLIAKWEREAATAVARSLHRTVNAPLFIAGWLGMLASSALSLFPRLKNSCFQAENEWRLAHVHTATPADCQVHSSPNCKTHVELNLGQLTGKLPITNVWLGPAVANRESEALVRDILMSKGHSVVIKPSNLPLRVKPERINFA